MTARADGAPARRKSPAPGASGRPAPVLEAPARGCLFPDACRGDLSTYKNLGCRGGPCADANATWKREAKRARARPDVVAMPTRLPTGQLRTHLAELREAGLGLNYIARRAGLDPRAVKRIAAGIQKRVTPRTKERLLAVMPSDLPGYALVPAGPTLEALDLLRDAGWTEAELAAEIRGPGTKRVDAGVRQVRKRTADRVHRLLEREFGPDLSVLSDPLADWKLLLADVGDREWRKDGECGRLDGDVKERQRPFFPTRGEVDVTAPRAVCRRCAVQEPCLAFALANNEQGIWGATTGDNRRDIRHLGLSAAEVLDMQAQDPDRTLAELLAERIAEAERAQPAA